MGALRGFVLHVQRNSQSRLGKTQLRIKKINLNRFDGAVKFAGKLRDVPPGGQLAAIAQHFLLALFFFNLCEFEPGRRGGSVGRHTQANHALTFKPD